LTKTLNIFLATLVTAGFASACMTAEWRSVIGRAAGNRLQQQGGCNDPNGACIGGDRGCCRLVSWQSGRCPDEAIDVVLGGVGSGQRLGGALERLHRQKRRSDEIRVRPVDELRRSFPQRTQ